MPRSPRVGTIKKECTETGQGKKSRGKRSFPLVVREKSPERNPIRKGFLSGAFLRIPSFRVERRYAAGGTLQEAGTISTAPKARQAAHSIGIPRLTARRTHNARPYIPLLRDGVPCRKQNPYAADAQCAPLQYRKTPKPPIFRRFCCFLIRFAADSP